ncbi:MAG: hypothetical protein KF830_12240 [Planctomycetes bacterium]|nr:hypothetical protein [Planctomycetota bacterium]
MRSRLLVLVTGAVAAAPLLGQDMPFIPNFRVELGASAGRLEHRTDSSPLDGKTDAAMFRVQFEGVSRHGFGGGVQFEAIGTDDDLFADAGFNAGQITSSTLFLHFTYRLWAKRFSMPARIGVRFNGYELEDRVLREDITYGTIGPYLEIAPEFRFVDRRSFSWSLYGQFGAGFGFTGIDVDNDSNDYVATTVSLGGEVGTRLRAGPVEFSLGFITRWQSMDDSDPENGLIVLGYDSVYYGGLFSCSVVF